VQYLDAYVTGSCGSTLFPHWDCEDASVVNMPTSLHAKRVWSPTFPVNVHNPPEPLIQGGSIFLLSFYYSLLLLTLAPSTAASSLRIRLTRTYQHARRTHHCSHCCALHLPQDTLTSPLVLERNSHHSRRRASSHHDEHQPVTIPTTATTPTQRRRLPQPRPSYTTTRTHQAALQAYTPLTTLRAVSKRARCRTITRTA